MFENLVHGVCKSLLSITEVVEILNNPEKENVWFLLPVKPKGGEMFLYSLPTSVLSTKGKVSAIVFMDNGLAS